MISKRLRHGGHPVLRWCAGNVTLLRDSNGNYRPNKGKSTERIDPIVAGIIAIGRALANVTETKVYDGSLDTL